MYEVANSGPSVMNLMQHPVQAGLLWGLNGWALVFAACGIAGFWLLWRQRRSIGRFLGLFHESSALVHIGDPYGFHMRRCKDLIELTRQHPGYSVFIRNHSAGGTTWADARSILSLQTLGVHGPRKGDPLPIVEVRVHGPKPNLVMKEIRRVLEGDPHKYLSVYDLDALAQKIGGRVVARLPQKPRGGWWRRMRDRVGGAIGGIFKKPQPPRKPQPEDAN